MGINTEREDLLRKVKGLIAKADGTDNPHEADAFRAKADAMMLKYSISQFELKDESNASREVVFHDYDMEWYSHNPHADNLWIIMQSVAKHCRCVPVHWRYSGLSLPVVGTDADYEYFDMLFTSIMLEHGKGLEPHPRKGEDMIEYLVRAKEAGMKWERIGDLMLQAGIADFPEYTRNVGVRFTKLYTDYCTEHERPRLRVQPSVYQRSFSLGFKAEIVDRLFKMRRESEKMYDTMSEGKGTELVLADMKRLVDARVRQLFGEPPRSSYGRARTDNRKVDSGAVSAGRQAASRVDLGARKVGTNIKQIER